MPRMVTAGRAQSMSETLPSPSNETPSSIAVESLRNWSGGYGSPDQVWRVVQPFDRRVAVAVAQARQHRDESCERVRGSAAEHAGVHLGPECLDGHHHVDHAAQAHRDGGPADGRVAGVADQDRVGAEQVGVVGHECLEAAGALFLRSLDHELQIHRHVLAECAEGGEVHDDVALAVSGSAAVPAAVDLGQLERRRAHLASSSGGCTS